MPDLEALEETIVRLQAIDRDDFEAFAADVFEEAGWDTETTQLVKDGGVDVVLTETGLFQREGVLQAKRPDPGNKVGEPDLREYASLKLDTSVDFVVVVTSSPFTRDAYQYGNDKNVKLLDGALLAAFIQERGLEPLLDEYAPPIETLDVPDDVFDVQEKARDEYYGENELALVRAVIQERGLLAAMEVLQERRAAEEVVATLEDLRASAHGDRDSPPVDTLEENPGFVDPDWFSATASPELAREIVDDSPAPDILPDGSELVCYEDGDNACLALLLPPGTGIKRRYLEYVEAGIDYLMNGGAGDQTFGIVVGGPTPDGELVEEKLSRLRNHGFDVMTYGQLLERSVTLHQELLGAVKPYYQASGDQETLEKISRLEENVE